MINENKNNINNQFKAFLPNAFLTYRFGISENLNFNYFSELNEPALRQLQPIVNNSNPLAIYQGNPNLRPELMHMANLSYMKYSAFNFTMLYASMQMNYTRQKIKESIIIDSALVRYLTPVNTNNETTLSGRLEFDTPIRPMKIKIRTVLKGNYNKAISVINQLSFPTDRMAYGFHLAIENRNKDIVDAIVGYRISQTQSRSTQNKDLNQSFNDQTVYAEMGLNFKDWVQFKSNFDYQLIQSTFSDMKFFVPLWTASLTTIISKDKKWRISLSCFDILNKNKGIRSLAQANYSDIIQSNVLGRYFLLGIAYNLKGFKKPSGLVIDVKGND